MQKNILLTHNILCYIALLFAFTGCDSDANKEPSSHLVFKKVELDQQLIQKVDQLYKYKNMLTAFQFELEKPKFELLTQQKPLLKFETESDFNNTVKALRTISLIEKSALEVHESLKTYILTPEPLLSVAELSLLDEQGRVIIGNKIFKLSGDKTVVSDVETHKVLKTITPDDPKWVSSFKQVGKSYKSKGKPEGHILSDPINGCNPSDEDCRHHFSETYWFTATNGLVYPVKALMFHDAWTSFFRTKTMVYTGFFFEQTRNFYGPNWVELSNLSQFYGGKVEADIVFRRGSGCPWWTSPTYSSTTKGTVSEDFNYRCENTHPRESYHTAILGGNYFLLNRYLLQGNGY